MTFYYECRGCGEIFATHRLATEHEDKGGCDRGTYRLSKRTPVDWDAVTKR